MLRSAYKGARFEGQGRDAKQATVYDKPLPVPNLPWVEVWMDFVV